MSHFTTFVIVATSTLDAMEMTAVELLEPFDENTEVDPYETECYCVGMIARNAGSLAANSVEDISDIRNEFHQRVSGKELTEKQRDTMWKLRINGWKERARVVEESHPLYNKPDPECGECGGTGVRQTTYNPKSKWDWYSLGGRWKGMLGGKDICTVKEWFEKGYETPFALLEPDGTWNEQGQMGWWAIVTDEKDGDDWDEQVRQILNKYYDHHSIMCFDLHI